jgi:hypothetical protein
MTDTNIDAEALQRIPFFTGLSSEDADSVLQVG